MKNLIKRGDDLSRKVEEVIRDFFYGLSKEQYENMEPESWQQMSDRKKLLLRWIEFYSRLPKEEKEQGLSLYIATINETDEDLQMRMDREKKYY